MKSTLLSESHGRGEWAVVFDPGDEAMAGLRRFAAERQLTSAHFTGIGALSDVTTGWFNLGAQRYEPTEIREQVEPLSLIGDVAEGPDGKPAVHAHIVVGKRDGTAHGGHLLAAHVRPTLELVLVEYPKHLERKFDASSGLALIRVE